MRYPPGWQMAKVPNQKHLLFLTGSKCVNSNEDIKKDINEKKLRKEEQQNEEMFFKNPSLETCRGKVWG